MKPTRTSTPVLLATVLAATAAHLAPAAATGETYRGIAVAPERRCAPYDRDDYPYPQSVEPRIIASMGGVIYGPYESRCFANRSQTDIEHLPQAKPTTADCARRGLQPSGGSQRTS